MKYGIAFLIALPMWAQGPLSLREAAQMALRTNRSLAAASAGVLAAEARIEQARSGRLPKVNYAESFARSNNPGVRLQFPAHPTPVRAGELQYRPAEPPRFPQQLQSTVSVDQVIYDAGETRNGMKSAELNHQMTAEQQRAAQMQVISGVARAYYGAVLAAESLKTAEQAVRSAEEDLRRAESVRSAGMSTDVDVLSIRVHLAAMHEQRIQRAADLDIARSALNDALGLPLDTPHELTTALAALEAPAKELAGIEKAASDGRPETRQSRLAVDLARTGLTSARSTRLPQVVFHGAFEADRQRFINRGGANWLASVGLRWNIFNGFADRARVTESTHWLNRAEADEQRVDSAVRLEVRKAWAGLRAAAERIQVARAAVAEAEESLRITQNRYEAGMSNVTDLLRNETAVMESRTRYLAAVHDQRIAATMLELAAGRLTADSEVLN